MNIFHGSPGSNITNASARAFATKGIIPEFRATHTGWWYSDILLSGHLKPQVDGTHGPHWLRNNPVQRAPRPAKA